MSACFFFHATLMLVQLPVVSDEPVTIPRAVQFRLTSSAGRDYRIYLYEPRGDVPQSGFPVLYFTDANTTFPLAVALASTIARRSGPVALVGVGYPTDDANQILKRRMFDLTPETSSSVIQEFQQDRRAALTKKQRVNAPLQLDPSEIRTGGKDDLFRFVQEEVKPNIERRLKIDRNRQALFGHSFGGLFALHACLEHPESFQTFVVSSPSLWLNPTAVATAEKGLAGRLSALQSPPRVIVTADHQERASDETRSPAEYPRTASALADRLQSLGLEVSFRKFDDENHGSVVPRAMMNGLRAAF